MWHLNSLELNPLDYHPWGPARGLSRAHPEPNMVAELKVMPITQGPTEKAEKEFSKRLKGRAVAKGG